MPCARPASTSARFSAWFWARDDARSGNLLASRWQPRWYSMQAQNDQPLPDANRRSKSAHVAGVSSLMAYITEMVPSLRPPNAAAQPRLEAAAQRRLGVPTPPHRSPGCSLCGTFRHTPPSPGVCLSDHLVRQEEECRRESEAERLGGLEVDDQLELGGLLDGEVPRLGAFQDAVHIVRSTAKHLRKARPIGHQPARLHKLPLAEEGRQTVR